MVTICTNIITLILCKHLFIVAHHETQAGPLLANGKVAHGETLRKQDDGLCYNDKDGIWCYCNGHFCNINLCEHCNLTDISSRQTQPNISSRQRQANISSRQRQARSGKVKCYECSSSKDEECGDLDFPMDKFPQVEAPLCAVHIFETGKVWRSAEFEKKEDGSCEHYSGALKCYCGSNFCNSEMCDHCGPNNIKNAPEKNQIKQYIQRIRNKYKKPVGVQDSQKFSTKNLRTESWKEEPCPHNCDFKRFHSKHSAVLPHNSFGKCPGKVRQRGVTKDEMNTILKLHNELRSKVARGDENLGNPGPQPSGSNIRELKWNCELAEVAQGYAEQCPTFDMGHDENKERQTCSKKYDYVGQNIFFGWTTSPQHISEWETAIKEWYDEVKDFPNNYVDAYRKVEGKVLGHYTQLVWWETFEIGCGAVYFVDGKKSDFKIYICNYGPGGNYRGETVYKRGDPASNCDDGPSENYSDLCN